MKTILIVDDQSGIRILLNEVFQREGFKTILAANGLEALKLFSEQQVDGVILDMKIPGMNGLEILQHIKEKKSDIPVMMMTAYGEQDLINTAMSIGAVGYFTKPFNIFWLVEEVKKALISNDKSITK